MSQSNEKKSLNKALGESNESNLNAAVALLALIQAAKEEAGVSGAPPPPLSDLLLKIGKLHMDTVSALVKLSSDHTDQLVTYMRDRRAVRRGGGAKPVMRSLLSLDIAPGHDASGLFYIKNLSEQPRAYRIPELLELKSLSENQPGAFVRVELSDPSGGPFAAPVVKIPSKADDKAGRFEAKLVIPWDDRLAIGRYMGVILFEADSAPPAELIVELLVRPAAELKPRAPV